jgi:hypothetical protein
MTTIDDMISERFGKPHAGYRAAVVKLGAAQKRLDSAKDAVRSAIEAMQQAIKADVDRTEIGKVVSNRDGPAVIVDTRFTNDKPSVIHPVVRHDEGIVHKDDGTSFWVGVSFDFDSRSWRLVDAAGGFWTVEAQESHDKREREMWEQKRREKRKRKK